MKTASGTQIRNACFCEGIITRVIALNEWGETGIGSLFRAILTGNRRDFEDMIERERELVASRAPTILGGDSVSHVAAFSGNVGALLKLAERGILNPMMLNARGQNALDVAQEEGKKTCEKFLRLLM